VTNPPLRGILSDINALLVLPLEIKRLLRCEKEIVFFAIIDAVSLLTLETHSMDYIDPGGKYSICESG
jgi:hypothetical protein